MSGKPIGIINFVFAHFSCGLFAFTRERESTEWCAYEFGHLFGQKWAKYISRALNKNCKYGPASDIFSQKLQLLCLIMISLLIRAFRTDLGCALILRKTKCRRNRPRAPMFFIYNNDCDLHLFSEKFYSFNNSMRRIGRREWRNSD